jgi:pimeloyl-ACP methyl ester carboxylesterase
VISTTEHSAPPRAARPAQRELEVVELPGGPELSAIVLLHEGLGSAQLWRDFPRALNRATGRRVITYSRYGHGRSAPPPTPRTPSFFHEEALEVLPELLARMGVTAPILVGHSDGASIALIHAGSHAVGGVVLLAPHVFVEEITVAAIRETRERYCTGDLRERMARHHDDPDVTFSGWCDVWLDPAFRAWTIESEAEGITAPVQLIQGSDDPYGSLQQIDRIEARVRGPVERVVLPGGHSPHFEHPAAVVAAVAGFARRLG